MVANEQLDIFELERGGFVISPPTVYSPGRSKKKKARHIMSATAQLEMVEAASASARQHITIERGMGLTRLGGGSVLE